jgi:hypothetical protein
MIKLWKTLKVIGFGIGVYLLFVVCSPFVQFLGMLRYIKENVKYIWKVK